MEFDKVVSERHSVRRFSTKKVDWKDVVEAVDAARLTPLAGNIPTLRFVIVSDRAKIKEISEACQESFVSQAQYIVVVCSVLTQVVRNYDEDGEVYARQQAGAGIQNFLLKLTELGLGSCWIGDFAEEQVKRISHIPEDVNVEAVIPIGYEMPPKAKPRKKFDLDRVMFFDMWGERYMKPLKRVEAI
ncbi:MAG: nitroreductase family protein [Nanoarchaeota archaeon]